MTLATYHNHSTWSDGKASVRQIIDAAREMTIAEVGISDHWVLHPRGERKTWAMPVERLPAYVQEILGLKAETAKKTGFPTVRLGLEVDWFPGHGHAISAALRDVPFDYLIGSCHEVEIPGMGSFVIDMSPESWRKLTQDHRNEIHRAYWRHMRTMGQAGLFDIVAHIDLPKKFGFQATIDLSREIAEALDAIAADPRRPVVELNTSGWHKPCEDGYPTLDILKQCRKRDIRATINADAHQPDHLLRDFAKAAERLRAAGYSEVAWFANRQVTMEPLAEAVRGL